MSIEQALKGRTIVEAYEESDGSERWVALRLDNGQKVIIRMEGAPGADNEWYQWLIVKVNGLVVFKG